MRPPDSAVSPQYGAALLIFAVIQAITGCAARPCRTCTHWHATEPAMDITQRGALVVDTTAVGASTDLSEMLPLPPISGDYYELTSERCQCLAATNCSTAQLIDQERWLASQTHRRHATDQMQVARLNADLLGCRAYDERNQAAADALRAYYRLAEAEKQLDLIHASLTEVDRGITDYERLKSQGLRSPEDEDQTRRQRTELLDRQAQLVLAVSQLNGALRQLLGLGPHQRTPIWPTDELMVTVAPVDVEQAVGTGIALRPDLAALRLLCSALESVGPERIGEQLARIDPSLGGVRFACDEGQAVFVRRQQIGILQRSQQHAAEEEIRQAAQSVQSHLVRIALAKEQRGRCQDRLRVLTRRRAVDDGTTFEVRQARLRLNQAESDLVQQVVAWKLAQVQLEEAQGTLPMDCGFWPVETLCQAT